MAIVTNQRGRSGCLVIFLILIGVFYFAGVVNNSERDSARRAEAARIQAEAEAAAAAITAVPVSEEAREQEIASLTAELRSIPVEQHQENLTRYQRLSFLDPENALYQSKVDFYQTEIARVEKDRLAAAARSEKIESMFSAWDGSHIALKRVVRENVKDPSSFDHTKTVYWDEGSTLLVRMDYRAANSFGALVPGVAIVRTDLDGNILDWVSFE